MYRSNDNDDAVKIQLLKEFQLHCGYRYSRPPPPLPLLLLQEEDDVVPVDVVSTLQQVEPHRKRRRRKLKIPVFPPLLLSNVYYSRGVRIPIEEDEEEEEEGVTVERSSHRGTPHSFTGVAWIPKDYYHRTFARKMHNMFFDSSPSKSPPLLVQLTWMQSLLWSLPDMAQHIVTSNTTTVARKHKKATTTARTTTTATTTRTTTATTQPPSPPFDPKHTFRLLGTITRTIQHPDTTEMTTTDEPSHTTVSTSVSSKTSSSGSSFYLFLQQVQRYRSAPPSHYFPPSSYYMHHHHHNNRNNTTGITTRTKPSRNKHTDQPSHDVPPPPPLSQKITKSIQATQQRRWQKRCRAVTTTTPPRHAHPPRHDPEPDWSEVWNTNIVTTSTTASTHHQQQQHDHHYYTPQGDLSRHRIGTDSNYISVTELYQMLPPDNNDDNATMKELRTILQACQELSNPTELWNVPLIMVYPIVKDEVDVRNRRVVSVQLGIYTHRLLMETFTTHSLRILLNELDVHSYHVTIPKCTIGTTTTSTETNANRLEDPVFVSSPYPVVVYDQQHSIGSSHANPTKAPSRSTGSKASTETIKRVIDSKIEALPPPPKKPKVICIDLDDEEDDRKMPARSTGRDVSPLSTTAIALDRPQPMNDDDAITTAPLVLNTVSAFTPTGLLKILEQEGCGDLSHNVIPHWYDYYMTHIQPLLASHLRLSLLPHQQYAVVWMYRMEHLPNFGINSLFWEEREFLDWYDKDGPTPQNTSTSKNAISNKYYVNTALGQIRFEPPETMKGGLLCDEMGLGKTFDIIALIVSTITELKLESSKFNVGRTIYRMTHATLIIVPASLISQWENEIVKCAGTGLIVEIVDGQTGDVSRRTDATGEADIVLTTYKALVRRPAALVLQGRRWGRIVLDEMQEIRSSTSVIAKSCEQLQGYRRWLLSGTPIFDGIDDLRGELNFLRLEPFSAASEDGFFDFMIKQPWMDQNVVAIETLKVLSKVVLRRSKNMTIKSTGAPIMDLKPLTVEFVPVQQTRSERAIYYFLESVLARVALSSNVILKTGRQAELNKAKASRRLCFRLLRDACNAVVLLNGGMGVQSQLPALNNVLIAEARRNARSFVVNGTNEMTSQPQVFSCDEAILHLAQVQHAVRTGADEVACLALGLGQGIAKRSHASESADAKYNEANERIQKAKLELLAVKSERAKAQWIKALEMVTMGQVRTSKTLKFKSTWAWRSLLCHVRYENGSHQQMPHALSRGWRPSPHLVSNWHTLHPEFHWAHPNALKLENIPQFLSALDLIDTICNVLIQLGLYKSLEVATRSVRLFAVEKRNEISFWDAWLQFERNDDCNVVLHKATSSHGIVIPNTNQTPMMVEVIASCTESCDKAHSSCVAYPTEANHVNQDKAAKALKLAQLGLRIARHGTATGTIKVSPAFGSYRTVVPRLYETMYRLLSDKIGDCTEKIYSLLATIRAEQITIERLGNILEKGAMEANESIRATSAFEKLQALASGNQHETHCCICLDYLGSNCHDCLETSATIAMIDCGHFYCRQCLASCRSVCPTCRRPFNFSNDVSYIDLTKTSDRDEAALEMKENEKAQLREAYHMLQEHEGVMDPSLWDTLYHAISAPDNSFLDVRVPALPRHFLGHVRDCIKGCHPELPMLCPANSRPYKLDGSEPVLSSKMKALLNDIPREERSVVFSTSSATIKLLSSVLDYFGIRCRSLFVGQNVESSESALLEWQSKNENGLDEPPCPVLLVQAGAAASGLTLTAASKMFLMEPFLRYSEELQAYGRCHRHGQTNAVYVKCYYVPMSMESRLLDRRKRAKEITGTLVRATAHSTNDRPINFSNLYGDDSDDDA